MDLGEHFRAIRKERGLTLLELARRSGVDQATISRIETGKMAGTLDTHRALARALGLTLAELYAGLEDAPMDRATVQQQAISAEPYVHHTSHVDWKLLTRDVLQKKMMPLLVTIEPQGSTARETLPFGTERFVYVLNGELQLRLGDEQIALATGHTVYFQAHLPHTMTNRSQQTARCVVVSTPPA